MTTVEDCRYCHVRDGGEGCSKCGIESWCSCAHCLAKCHKNTLLFGGSYDDPCKLCKARGKERCYIPPLCNMSIDDETTWCKCESCCDHQIGVPKLRRHDIWCGCLYCRCAGNHI